MAIRFNRRKFLVYGSAAWGTSFLLKGCANNSPTTAATPTVSASPAAATSTSGGGDTIKVGILHSLSGTLSVSEKSVVDAELLAIEEINNAGGVLGKKIQPIVEDGASD